MASIATTPATPSSLEDSTPSSQLSPSPSTSKSDYIRTATQNYISRSATIHGAPNLNTKGKSIVQADATIHGDYGAPIHIGRYCHLDRGVVLIPSVVPSSMDPILVARTTIDSRASPEDDDDVNVTTSLPPGKNERALPLIIGSHTQIGPNTCISSISVGSCVRIGANCTLGPRSKIHDCCIIEDGTLIPPDMVVPPFSRVRGSPGKIVGTLPECCGGEFVEGCVQDYLHFVRRLKD